MHDGAIPGLSAEVYFLPDDNVGIVALANGDAKHQYELALIYRIIEDFLGLERKESERILHELHTHTADSKGQQADRSRTSEFGAKPTTPLSLPLHHYAGTYYDPGYGNLTFCAPTPHPSPACAPVLGAWAAFANVTDPATNELYVAVSSVWISHIRLTHTDGDAFGLSGTYLFPEGFGKDRSPFMSSETADTVGTVTFWVRDAGGPQASIIGAAINGFVGEQTERQRLGGSLAETAEVWLQRV
jgi:hypothetical protein